MNSGLRKWRSATTGEMSAMNSGSRKWRSATTGATNVTNSSTGKQADVLTDCGTRLSVPLLR